MTYVMSDIHGQYKLFLKMLKTIHFCESDTLYVLGDVIDRGPDGIDCLQDIMKRKNIKMILGNHEHMMLNAMDEIYRGENSDEFETFDCFRIWQQNGCKPTMAAFNDKTKKEQKDILSYLKDLPVNIEITINEKAFLLTHAAPLPKYFTSTPFEMFRYANDREFAVWSRRFPHVDIGKTVIFGHTSTAHFQRYEPMRIYKEKGGNYIGIDCGCAYITENCNNGGRLGCVRLDDMKNFYSGG